MTCENPPAHKECLDPQTFVGRTPNYVKDYPTIWQLRTQERWILDQYFNFIYQKLNRKLKVVDIGGSYGFFSHFLIEPSSGEDGKTYGITPKWFDFCAVFDEEKEAIKIGENCYKEHAKVKKNLAFIKKRITTNLSDANSAINKAFKEKRMVDGEKFDVTMALDILPNIWVPNSEVKRELKEIFKQPINTNKLVSLMENIFIEDMKFQKEIFLPLLHHVTKDDGYVIISTYNGDYKRYYGEYQYGCPRKNGKYPLDVDELTEYHEDDLSKFSLFFPKGHKQEHVQYWFGKKRLKDHIKDYLKNGYSDREWHAYSYWPKVGGLLKMLDDVGFKPVSKAEIRPPGEESPVVVEDNFIRCNSGRDCILLYQKKNFRSTAVKKFQEHGLHVNDPRKPTGIYLILKKK